MASRKPTVSSRKLPQQARSSDLVAAILAAAVQVLEAEGAQRFTTARVAERAGVSVGSLYQYFPNKAAILFRLQCDEWERTRTMMRAILEERDRPVLDRLRTLVHAFIRSECEEATVRLALKDAAPLYRNAPEATAARAGNREAFARFLAEALPDRDTATRQSAEDLIRRTLGAVGSSFSASPHTPADIASFSQALADMLCVYLERLAQPVPSPAPMF